MSFFAGLILNSPEVEERRRKAKMSSILAKKQQLQPLNREMLHLLSVLRLNTPSSCSTELFSCSFFVPLAVTL